MDTFLTPSKESSSPRESEERGRESVTFFPMGGLKTHREVKGGQNLGWSPSARDTEGHWSHETENWGGVTAPVK